MQNANELDDDPEPIDSVVDVVADGLISQIVVSVERLAPADRDEVLARLKRALAVMLPPQAAKYLRG